MVLHIIFNIEILNNLFHIELFLFTLIIAHTLTYQNTQLLLIFFISSIVHQSGEKVTMQIMYVYVDSCLWDLIRHTNSVNLI